MASPLRHCALRLPAFREAPDPTIDTHRAYTRGTVEYVTFPTGRITGLQSADCIEMIEIQTGGGDRDSCTGVVLYSRTCLLELRVRRGKTQVRTLHRCVD